MRLRGQRDHHPKYVGSNWFGQLDELIIEINDRNTLKEHLNVKERILTYNGSPCNYKTAQIPRICHEFEK